ncbi:MAG: amino-acid N-acetyltransferase [Proteobacteria bacterium]|nr:amino-acid N-acetyltransferase [Pseudomonadota bacterium]
MKTTDYAQWFRDSTPYISAHRGKTFVVLLGGEAIEHANLTNIVHDLALMHVLGVRLVLVHGARPQIDSVLPITDLIGDRRITGPDEIRTIAAITGQIRAQLEGLFSTGLPTSPLHNVNINLISGNFVTARPLGVVDGVDHLLTGTTRSVRANVIRTVIDTGGVVLLSPTGYSPSGQMFNLAAHELAADVAIALNADKILVLDPNPYAVDTSDRRLSILSPQALDELLDRVVQPVLTDQHLRTLMRAVRGGVRRGHLVSYVEDGALLRELFTAEGTGTQITEESHQRIRQATIEDVAGIVEIIRPLEEQGFLVRRSRDRLEREVEHFMVADIDGIVVGCCACYPIKSDRTTAEVACVAVHPSHRTRVDLAVDDSLGKRLLTQAERRAAASGVTRLYILTTQAQDWFLAQGYKPASVDDLPGEKQALYNYQRKSSVMIKTIENIL